MTSDIEVLASQLVCRHKRTRGGNDYVECPDCGLEWDYTKSTPLLMLRAANDKRFQEVTR